MINVLGEKLAIVTRLYNERLPVSSYSYLLWFASNRFVAPAGTTLMGARVQYPGVHWEGHALCRVQGKKEEDNSELRHQERLEIPEAQGAPRGAFSPLWMCACLRSTQSIPTAWQWEY